MGQAFTCLLCPKVTSLSKRRLLTTYALAALCLSSLTARFEWAAPIANPEGALEWYREVGVSSGALVLKGHLAPGGGLRLDLHRPQLFPVPFHSGAGFESGGSSVAVWFAVAVLAALHLLARAPRRNAEL